MRRSAQIRGALALAFPVLIAAPLYGAVVAPLRDRTAEYRDELVQQTEMAGRYAAIAGRRDLLESELDAVEAQQRESAHFLTGETAPVASAALQERLADAVRGEGGSMRSAAGSAEPAKSGLERITANARFAADVEQLGRILYRLEAAEPLIFVETLTLGGQVRAEGGSVTARRMLEVSLTVSGYRVSADGEDPS